MDFGSLLYAAKKNDYNRKESKCYVTKFQPPKKVEKSKNLSVNVKKFLAKKDEEEKRKALEAKKKRDELLALRSQDGKANKRVQAMLNRTKAANKSAISDAVDDNNTAVTIGGCAQPDEDDYGYVSQEASAFYNKLMDKYNSLPQEEAGYSKKRKSVSKDLSSTKDRVKMALQRKEEEELLPHKRKRRTKEELERGGDKTPFSKENVYESHVIEEKPCEEKPKEKPKPKKMLPPPMDFQTLLKIAEQKQFEPIKIEPKKEIKTEEVSRPMTKKQRAEYQKEMERQMRKQQSNGKSNIESLKNSKMHDEILHNIRISTSRQFHSKSSKLSDTQEIEQTPPIKKTADSKISISSSKSSIQSRPVPEKSKQVSDNFRNNESKSKQYLPGDLRNESSKNEPKAKQYLPGDLRYEGNKSNSNDSRNSMDNNKQSENRNRSLQNDKKVSNKEIVRSKQNCSNNKSKDTLDKSDSDKSRPLYSSVENNKSKQERNGQLANKSKISERRNSSAEKAKENKKSDNSSDNTIQRQYLPGDLRYKPNQKSNQESIKVNPNKQNSLQGREAQISNTKMKQEIKSKSDIRPKQFPPADLKPKQFPPADLKPKQFPPADLKRKQFPPADLKRKRFPPPGFKSRQFPPKDVKRKPFNRRIESDDEYDSELDDFIDDGPEEGEDYSQHIRDIFGYDKSKYTYADEDEDQCMESNFAQQLKEEFVSTKIGIMEDLEDIKKEQEEKKRKTMKAKNAKLKKT